MVHGRGAGPGNILDLLPVIGHPGLAALAPTAAGGTWYPLGFMSPLERNEPGISSGIAVVHSLIDEAVAAGIAPERIALLGFSQGACLACTAAQRRPVRQGGVLVFSGGLIGPPGTAWVERGRLQGTPLYFGCGDADAHIPEARVRESAAVFGRMGASVTLSVFPGMGHSVNDEELAFARELLAGLAS